MNAPFFPRLSLRGAATLLLIGAGLAAPVRATAQSDSTGVGGGLGPPVDASSLVLQGGTPWEPPPPSAPPPPAGSRGGLIRIDRGSLPPAAHAEVSTLNVRDADLRDVLRALADQYGLNVVVDNTVDRRVTARLSRVSAIDALAFLAQEHGLSLVQNGSIFRVSAPEPLPPPPPEPVRVRVEGGLLWADLDSRPVTEVARAVAERGGLHLLVRPGVEGPVSGLLQGVPLEVGFRSLLANNGFSLRERDGVHVVDYTGGQRPAPGGEGGYSAGGYGRAPRSYGGAAVEVEDGLVSLDVSNAPAADLLRELAAQAGVSLVVYRAPEGEVTARFERLPFERALGYLLRGTGIGYRRDGDLYVVGAPQEHGAVSARLLPLRHLQAEHAVSLVPEAFRAGATLQPVKELNGIAVTGPPDRIDAIEHYLFQVDRPTPVVLIEALVVDFEESDLSSLGVALGLGRPDSLFSGRAATFGGNDGFGSGLRAEADGPRTNRQIARAADLFGIGGIGRLPADFYLRIQALERDGRARVRSRPQIATLNGHTASLSVGTTQYYILRSVAPIPTNGQPLAIETERFERIDANVSLTVTPYVTASGEVTVEIKPEFSTPIGGLNPNVPPTINTRVLESTVRLREGETIVLGGLIQEGFSGSYNKFPILGDLPLLGRLFRSQTTTTRRSELVVYLTPYVFYGEDDDEERWRGVRERIRRENPGADPDPPRDGWGARDGRRSQAP